MSEAKKQGHGDHDELPAVFRLADGRLIWHVVPRSIEDVRVLKGRRWVPLEDATVGQILDADGLSEDEIRELIARGILKAR
jgi:hypothetical protein